jgi:hypothetical protein
MQSRVQVTALDATAQTRASKFEGMLSSIPVVNMKNGFFDAQIPQSALIDADVASILAPVDLQVAELALACAAESCLALGEASAPLTNEALVISIAEFEQA